MYEAELALMFIAVGVMFRTMIPALRKIAELAKAGTRFEWNHAYTWAAILGIVVVIIVSIMGFQMYAVPAPDIPILTQIVTAIIFGVGLNDIIVEVYEWV